MKANINTMIMRNYLINKEALSFTKIISIILFVTLGFSGFAQNYPPSCVVTSPHSNAYFQQNSDVIIRAYSTDQGKTQQNGSVTKVEFFVDGQKIGESSSQVNNTYSFTWNCAQTGEYRITAKATNDKGVSFTSVGQFVTVGTQAVAQHGMSANKGKYLANIIANSPNIQYNELWNGVSAENACKWGTIENTRDSYDWRGADNCYNHAKNYNLMFRYHAIAWGNQTPLWLEGLQYNQTDFKAELEEYIVGIAQRYKYMDQVDVLNEQIGTHAPNTQWFRNGLGGTGSTGYDWAIYLFQRARELLPNTKLVVNDYGLVRSTTNIDEQLRLVALLRDRGLIDGYGTQSHDFSVDGQSASGLKSDLDRMARGGVPVYVTELDMRGGVDSENNDAQQLSSYQSKFPVYWEHPAVGGITLWGYVVGATWRTGTGIIQSNGTPKSALTWLKQYMSGRQNVGYPFGTIPGTCCETAPPTVTQDMYAYAIGETATQLSASGNSLTWYSPDGTSSSTAPTPSTSTVGTFTYSVTQTSGCESVPTNITVVVYQPQGPYGGTPATIPGRIEFENYDIGGQDSAYYDVDAGTNVDPAPNFRNDEDVDIETCTDTDGGYNLGWTAAGEWTEYTVNITAGGTYNIDIRVACNGDDRTIALSIDGNSIANNIVIPNTGGWQVWETITVPDVQLESGIHVIRMTIGATDYVNLNYMEFDISGTPPSINITAPTNNAEFTTNDNIEISATASATDATITDVKFYVDDQLVNTDNSSPYSFTLNTLAVGTYVLKATATDSNGLSASETVQVTISEAPAIVQLKTGWNLIGCPITGSTDIMSALSSIWSHIISVKDADSFYLQSQPDYLNTLKSLDWGSGYLIKVDADCDLNWKTN